MQTLKHPVKQKERKPYNSTKTPQPYIHTCKTPTFVLPSIPKKCMCSAHNLQHMHSNTGTLARKEMVTSVYGLEVEFEVELPAANTRWMLALQIAERESQLNDFQEVDVASAITQHGGHGPRHPQQRTHYNVRNMRKCHGMDTKGKQELVRERDAKYLSFAKLKSLALWQRESRGNIIRQKLRGGGPTKPRR